jgi:protein TonB
MPVSDAALQLQRRGGAVASPQPGAPATAPRPGQRAGGPQTVAPPAPAAIGPLERQAKPITPENPVPRRTYSVPVDAPAGAPEFRGVIQLRVTLDQQGRPAEVRSMPTGLPQSAAPSVQAAIAAVKQWQYDPPAEAPISFSVVVSFSESGVVRTEQISGPAIGGVVGTRDGVLIAERYTRPNVQPGPSTGVGGAAPVRVGGAIMPPVKTRHVDPEYPAVARSARVQGVVILEVVIGSDGRVGETRTLRSIPLLDQAAHDAVRQWEFTPTMLNGRPVPVIMTMTVQFTLSDEPPVQ